MKRYSLSAFLLPLAVATTFAQSSTPKAEETKPSTTVVSEDQFAPLAKPKTNPVCGGTAATSPCGATKKLTKKKSTQTVKPEDLLVAPADLASSSTPIDRNDFSSPGVEAIAISPEITGISLVRVNGVETATRNMITTTRVGVVKPHAANASAGGITNIVPDFGNPGTVVSISGVGFGPPKSSSYVQVYSVETFTNTIWSVQSWTDTLIIAIVPNMPPGKVYFEIYVAGVSLPTQPFTVGTPPVITSYSPAFGPPGTPITILGTGFGQSASTGNVSVTSAATNQTTVWPVASWTDTEIRVNVPSGFPSGLVYLYVTADGLEAIGTYVFTVGNPPIIDCYGPVSGPPGTLVTINGSEFGAAQGNSVVQAEQLSVPWTTWPVSSWSDTQITLAVPANASSAKYWFSVVVAGLRSVGTFPFEVGFPPVISSYSPGWGNPGTPITITGSGFGQTQGTSTIQALSSVTNEFTVLPVASWSDAQVVVSIPQSMSIGKVYLYAYVGPLVSIGTFPFDVGIPPLISSYSPNSGPATTIITINGTGFGTTQGSSYATLQSVTNIYTNLTVLSWGDTQVTVSVPNLAPICLNYLSVTVGGLQSPGTFPFQVMKQ